MLALPCLTHPTADQQPAAALLQVAVPGRQRQLLSVPQMESKELCFSETGLYIAELPKFIFVEAEKYQSLFLLACKNR